MALVLLQNVAFIVFFLNISQMFQVIVKVNRQCTNMRCKYINK